MKCECSDKGCQVHEGRAKCYNEAKLIVSRIDMNDWSGTPMCEECAKDALESGVFEILENVEDYNKRDFSSASSPLG